jgi:membrane protease subunit HflC
VILAEAQRDAETTRGEGDARATEIFANAFGKDTEFYEFYRSMNAYREALDGQSDIMVLDPDMEFFQHFGRNVGN